jgi:hypothetical protein
MATEFRAVRQEMATEFRAVRQEMATEFKAVRQEMATKQDLERYATKADLDRFATKEDLERYATRADLARMSRRLRADVGDLKTQMLVLHEDLVHKLSLLGEKWAGPRGRRGPRKTR